MVASIAPAPAARRRPALATLSLALALGLAGPATATVFTYELDAGVRHDDNVNLSEDDEQTDDIVFGSLRFVVRHETPRVDLRARGNLRYLHYLAGTYDDEVRGELAAQLDWTILPNRMHWVVEDYLSREQVDILGRPDPSNQQEVNVFLTGPTFLFRFGQANTGQLDLRYMHSYAEESDSFNGQRLIARGAIRREINPRTTASLHLDATAATFRDNGEANDYRRYDAYLHLDRRVPSLRIRADLGYTRIIPNATDIASSSPLLRTNVNWNPGGRHWFNGRFDYQLADSAQRLIQRSSDLATETSMPIIASGDLMDYYDAMGSGNIVVGSDAYRERRLDLGYRYEGDRVTVRVHPYVQRVRYLDNLSPGSANLDRKSRGEAIELSYKLRPSLDLAARVFDQRLDYQNIDRRDTIQGVSLALLDKSARKWRWRLEASHVRRNSSEPGQSYRDNVYGFAIIRTR